MITELPGQRDAALHAAESLHGLALELDLRDPAQAARCVANVVDRFGQLEVLVNNAGVVIRKPALELTVEDWDAVQDVNLRGAFFLAQAAAKVMTSRRTGRIVNIASIFGLVGGPDPQPRSRVGAVQRPGQCRGPECDPHSNDGKTPI